MMNLEEFLSSNRITKETWDSSGCDWQSLCLIRYDYNARLTSLKASATMYANMVQDIQLVHSVRWRLKDVEHLLAKIVRKKADQIPKYSGIDHTNYDSIVTDLIGVRALHLFKSDCFQIIEQLQLLFPQVQQPLAYVREGDPDQLREMYTQSGFEVRTHKAGYRSIHFLFTAQPQKHKITAEVQVRTVFEEGWSEIDHTIRYPNFTNDELTNYFLDIFNRTAGSADEMGSFVQELANAMKESQHSIDKANAEKKESLDAIDSLLDQLKGLEHKNTQSSATIRKLEKELQKMQKVPSIPVIPNLGSAITPFEEFLAGSAWRELNKNMQMGASRQLAIDAGAGMPININGTVIVPGNKKPENK